MPSLLSRVKYQIKNLIFKFHYGYCSVPIRNTKYYFSAVLVFKDEAPYLKEWIEFHRVVGVDHIYAYNDGSTDDYKEVLKPFVEEGFVTLMEWAKPHSQFEVYTDCYKRFREETFWMMFIDIDEFICPKETRTIGEWIKPFEAYPSVEIYWMHFTTSGCLSYDPTQLVIERFTTAYENLFNGGKMVLNTAFEPVWMYHHHIVCYDNFFFHKWWIPTVKEDRNFIFEYENKQYHKISSINTIQLNHYWSKSFEEYLRKMRKGDVSYFEDSYGRETLNNFLKHEYLGEREDKTIFRFLILLKIKLNKTIIPKDIWKETK